MTSSCETQFCQLALEQLWLQARETTKEGCPLSDKWDSAVGPVQDLLFFQVVTRAAVAGKPPRGGGG